MSSVPHPKPKVCRGVNEQVRVRNENGTFMADDLASFGIDEAWVAQ